MSAKRNLFLRLAHLNAATRLPQLIDQGIATDEHNGVANLLRKGLGIVAFNVLEDFIKNKSSECLSALSASNLPFDNLTDVLIDSSIWGALNALQYVASIVKKDGGDWKSLIQEETLKIHSTGNNPFELSKYSLVNGGSNVTTNEVNDLLRAFGIKQGWQKLKAVSDLIGGGIPDLSQAFQNAAARRHSSAHAADFRYEYNWLSNLRSEIIAIAASLDILLTARCRQISQDLTKKIDTHDIDAVLKFRFLEPKRGVFKESTSLNGKTIKKWPALKDAILHITPRLSAKNEFLIVLNSSKRIEDWYV